MNKELWDKILEFDFDQPFSEYGFSTRLAAENYWTKNFTKKAILEYKKFMYLAGSSPMMVSPSEVIDVVWHQHLIFTQSYNDFCKVIGKQILHVPSTHNKADAAKFKQAKERTKQLYAGTFGEQPAEIWEYDGMYESLRLEKANLKIRTFLVIGILALILLLVPLFAMLRPIYIHIGNPDFMFGYFIMIGLTFIALEIGSRWYLSKVIQDIGRSSFLFDLDPMELVYLKTQNVANVIHATMNKLVEREKLAVRDDIAFVKLQTCDASNLEEHQVLETFSIGWKIKYAELLAMLNSKPVFDNTKKCMDAFKKYFIKSKKFGSLFYLNFVVLGIVAAFGLVRLATGLLRDKPTDFLVMILLALLVFAILYLNRLTKLACTSSLPKFYKKELLPERKISEDWEWRYFLFGSAVLLSSFVPVYNSVVPQTGGDGGSSSCGSSCGSSCSSCGGCGGD